MLFDGIVGRYFKQGNGAKTSARLTSQGSLAVAQVESVLQEQSRAGRRFFGGCQVIANGINPVSAIPTTTATLALYNGEPDNGADLCVDRINFWLGSGTAAAGATLLITVAGPIATTPTMASNYSVTSASRGGKASKALLATSITLPGSPTWIGVLSTFQLAAANVGQGDGWAQLDGGLLVPPRYAMGIAILSGTGTSPLYGVSVQWSEMENDRE